MTLAVAPPIVPDLLGTSPADLVALMDAEPSTPHEARERAERIREGLHTYAEMRQDIAAAYAHRDWQALGYSAWAEYVRVEFGPLLRNLHGRERAEAVRDLRTNGMSTRQIASVTGVDPKTVRNDLGQVGTDSPPATVAGRDGKTYPATQPPRPALLPKRQDVADAIAAGIDAHAAAERPPAWDPEDRRRHEEEVARKQAIEAAHRTADTIVTTVLGAVLTVVSGSRYGERGLVTREMVAKLREAIDLLEGEISDAQ